MKANQSELSFTAIELDRIGEMAREDRTPFDAIWRMWRKRVQGRAAKHAALSSVDDGQFKANQQRIITHNKIAKG